MCSRKLADNFFSERIRKMFEKESLIGNYTKDELLKKISTFTNDNRGYFTYAFKKDNLQSHINELDFLLCLLFDYYDEKITKKNGDYLELGAILLIKSFIQDIIAIRNLTDMYLEPQMYNQARSLMERQLVLTLYLSDAKYREELIINSDSKNDKERFYKLTRPNSVLKKLKELQPQMFQLFYSDTWDDTYSLFSAFCHNDIYEWIRYFDEGAKYNLSLQTTNSNFLTYRLSYITQSIVVFSLSLIVCNDNLENRVIKDIADILMHYWQEIIDDSYKG